MHSTDYAVARCLSVCSSVTRLYCVETAKRFTSGSQTILVFPYQTLWQYSDWDPNNAGVECRWGMKMAIFDQYLALSRKLYKVGP